MKPAGKYRLRQSARALARAHTSPFALAVTITYTVSSTVQGQCVLQEIHAPPPYTWGYLGSAIALDGEMLLVAHTSGNSRRAVHLLEYNVKDRVWEHVQPLVSATGDTTFGSSVALDQALALVGSPSEFGSAVNSGIAYVYAYSPDASAWELVLLVGASDGASSDSFGRSVAIDGALAAIGADGDDDAGSESGSVYRFTHDPITHHWTEIGKTIASDAAAGDHFGTSLVLSSNTMVVGAPRADGLASGSAYVFRHDDPTGNWREEAKLTAAEGAPGDRFGAALAISQNTIVIGAPTELSTSLSAGAAYVFSYNEAGNTWAQRQRLTPLDARPGQRFGASVSIHGDMIVIGAPADNDLGNLTGAAYAFQRDSVSGVWTQLAKLSAPNARERDFFGHSVVVRDSILLIGAIGRDGNGVNTGSLYAFRSAVPVDDCETDSLPGTCYADCNDNGIRDACDLAFGTSQDCDQNTRPDECELGEDCNGNEVPDRCDLANGTSNDCNVNGIPEECELLYDCNENGEQDTCDIAFGVSLDEDANGLPDECPLLTIAYVAHDATGTQDGDSWQDAFVDIHAALRASALYPHIVEEIRVAQGTYTPAPPNGDRESSFHVTAGVALRGGYAGLGHPEPDRRDVVLYPTVLSADLNANDQGGPSHASRSDNGCRVVLVDADEASVTLDGFTIQSGHLDADCTATGAGIRSLRSSLLLMDCTIHNNYTSGSGGGLATLDGDVTARRCTFTNNAADWTGEEPAADNESESRAKTNPHSGGALYGYSTEVTLIDCSFTDNTSVGGSAIWAVDFHDWYTIRNCTFTANRTKHDYESAIEFSGAPAILEDCEVSESNGGGISTYSYLQLANCELRNNAGLAVESTTWSGLRVTSCAFINNAGGLRCRGQVVSVDRSLFRGNTVTGSGAGISYFGDGAASITDCTFINNSADEDGGAIWGLGDFTRCLFAGNTANSGGACYVVDGHPSFSDCAFTANAARLDGGAVFLDVPTSQVHGSTYSANSAGGSGGGIYATGETSVVGSIVWGNADANGAGEFSQVYSATGNTIIEYSDIQGWTAEGLGGYFNIDADPRFRDPLGPDGVAGTLDDDLRLASDSPCINTGTFTLCSPCCGTDIEGHPRSLCGRHDMGAYEFGIGDRDCDHDVDLEDYAHWFECLSFPNTAEFCESFDADADCDVDLIDFGAFQRAFGGP